MNLNLSFSERKKCAPVPTATATPRITAHSVKMHPFFMSFSFSPCVLPLEYPPGGGFRWQKTLKKRSGPPSPAGLPKTMASRYDTEGLSRPPGAGQHSTLGASIHGNPEWPDTSVGAPRRSGAPGEFFTGRSGPPPCAHLYCQQ